MTKIEIQKSLYKQKPTALFYKIQKGVAYYGCNLPPLENGVMFEIPVDDMGDTPFLKYMDAKLLGRWVVVEEEITEK